MDNDKLIKLVQGIGNEVCEGCGPDSDCGQVPSECNRIDNALEMLRVCNQIVIVL